MPHSFSLTLIRSSSGARSCISKSAAPALGMPHEEERMSDCGITTTWTTKLPESKSCPSPYRRIGIEKGIPKNGRSLVAENRGIQSKCDGGNWQPADPPPKDQVATPSHVAPKSRRIQKSAQTIVRQQLWSITATNILVIPLLLSARR